MTLEYDSSSSTVDPRDIFESDGLLFYVYCFLDEPDWVRGMLLSKWHHETLSKDGFYLWMLDRLHVDKGIHFPSRLPRKYSWKSLYLELRQLSNLWKRGAKNGQTQQQQFKVQVSVRFKPRSIGLPVQHRKKISLPLHQRLALTRAGLKLDSNAKALEVLASQGEWFGARFREERHQDENHRPRVNQSEASKAPQIKGGVQLIDSGNDTVFVVDRTKGLRAFRFDHVLSEKCEQRDIYDASTLMLVTDFINGFNATCLVYGQTGSGKTHTMFGSPENATSAGHKGEMGIVPRACADVFEAIEFRKNNLNFNVQHDLSISYIEVDGENASDLLRERAPCGRSRVASHRYALDGSVEVPVNTLDDLITRLKEGEQHKKFSSTAMNERSSRAHTMVILTLRQRWEGSAITSRLFMTDLGGSERVKKSQATRGQQMNEAIRINKGLFALKQCVEALVRGRPDEHVPYYSSKLTMMLSMGLGGNSKTSAVICAAQEEDHEAETIASMMFGESCSQIAISSRANIKENILVDSFIAKLDAAIARCEENIRQHERWEVQQIRQVDERASGSSDAVEVRTKTVLTGAETYRQELADLLKRKGELLGTWKTD